MTHLLDSLNVFYLGLTPNRAAVHALLAGGQELAGLTLAGIVRGPRCSRGSTLPATYRLQRQGSGRIRQEPGHFENRSYVAAQAVVTEPVYWTPDWPALYDVSVELRRENTIVAAVTRTIGLRPLVVAGKHLSYAGKTWVLRAAYCQRPCLADIDRLREHAALLAPADALGERLLTAATEMGAFVVAEISEPEIAAELSRLSRFAAVAMAVLPRGAAAVRPESATNILLAHRLLQGDQEPPPDDSRLLLADVTDERSFAHWAESLRRPVVACRLLPESDDWPATRAECDRLQRDLAPYGQFAGYIV